MDERGRLRRRCAKGRIEDGSLQRCVAVLKRLRPWHLLLPRRVRQGAVLHDPVPEVNQGGLATEGGGRGGRRAGGKAAGNGGGRGDDGEVVFGGRRNGGVEQAGG